MIQYINSIKTIKCHATKLVSGPVTNKKQCREPTIATLDNIILYGCTHKGSCKNRKKHNIPRRGKDMSYLS